jgi:hypothetical protein
MKNLYTIRVSTGLLLGLSLLMAFFSCSKVEDLLNTPIYVDTDILHNALTVQIINADGNWDHRPSKIEAEIIGKDKDKIYSLIGERKIEILDNHLKIGVRKIELPTPENPLEFSVVLKADGFLPTVKNYTITTDKPVFTFMYMVDEDNAPAEIAVEKNQSIINTSNGIGADQRLSTNLNGMASNQVEISFQQGTKAMTSNNQVLGGNLSVDLFSADNHSEVAEDIFPGGNYIYTNNPDGEGKIKKNLNPAAFGKIDMKQGNQMVKKLDKAASFNIRLNQGFTNPATGTSLAEGDDMELWGFDLASNEWTMLDAGKVKMTHTGLEATFDMTVVPDYWAVTNARNANGGVELFIHSAVNQDDPDRYYYVVIRQIPYPDGCCRQTIYEGYEKMYKGQTFFFANLPTEGAGVVEVYSSKYECNDKELLDKVLFFWQMRPDQDFGDYQYSKVNIFLDETTINGNDRFSITVDVFGVCANGDTVLRGVPSLDLQYSGIYCAEGEYELLGRLQSGVGTTGALKPGRNYNFYFEQGPVSRCQLNFPIPTQDTTYQIESPVYNFYENVDVDYDDINNSIFLQWHNVAVPQRACDEYRQYY